VNTTSATKKRPLSRVDRAILVAHALIAGTFGVIGFFSATDPGWQDLQRFVIVMFVGLWIAGIAAMAAVATFVHNPWARMALLLGGPFIGIALVFGRPMLGL